MDECLVQVKFGTILLYVLKAIVGQNVIFAVRLYHKEEKQHRRVTQAILKAISSAVMGSFTRNTRRLKRGQCSKEEICRGTSCSWSVNIAKREKSQPNATYNNGGQYDQVVTQRSTNNCGQFKACRNDSIRFTTLFNNF